MNYIYATGNFFGWLTIISFVGTILNYCIKFINKHWGKKLKTSPLISKILSLGMQIFVKRHRLWGFLAFLFLMLHFIVQFLRFGLSTSGLIAFVLLVFEVLLGLYAYTKKLKRKGVWFIIHRSIAILLIAGVIVHVQFPFGLPQSSSLSSTTTSNVSAPPSSPSSGEATTKSSTTNSSQTSSAQTDSQQTASDASSQNATSTQAASTETSSTELSFTLDELKTYNGKNGQPAYVAYKGTVYDVSNVPQWKNGSHHGVTAGTDVTSQMSKSPHGDSVLTDVPIIGTLKN